MSLIQRFMKFIGLDEPAAPEPTMSHHLSRRVQKHEFTLLKAYPKNVFKVSMNGRTQLLDMNDWRLFIRDLNIYFMDKHIRWSELERGDVMVRCVGYQESLPRGIKYAWTFSIL